MTLRTPALVLSLGVLCVLAGTSYAELPHVRLDRNFPLGGQSGAEVDLEISGRDLDDVTKLHFDHAGLKATHLKDKQFRLTIAPEVPPGTYEVRAIGKYGISAVQLFEIG